MILIGLLVLAPIIIVAFYHADLKYLNAFLLPGLFSIFIGLLICIFAKRDNIDNHWNLSSQNSSLTVIFTWFWGIFIGALPFFISKELSFMHSIFESVSAFTTTGLSVIDVSKISHIFLFHRSFMQFCGGLGFVMMMLILINGKQSMNLYNAEGHTDKLLPNLKKTAQIIFIMYNSFLLLGIIAYLLAGMNLFDSICHSMCSLSTGGFSTKLNSIGEYKSFKFEMITIILMLIGTTNFAALLILTKRKFKTFIKLSETRFMFLLLLAFIPITAILLFTQLKMSLADAFRHSAFNVISALSTSGYSSMSYQDWPETAIFIIILMMIIGGGIGSTAGGMKLSRIYLLFKIAFANINNRFSSQRRIKNLYYINAQGKTHIDTNLLNKTVSFVTIYILIFLLGSFIIAVDQNVKLIPAMFEFASSLGTVGLSIGLTSTTTPTLSLIVEIFGMLLGRLEIFIFFNAIYSAFNLSNFLRLKSRILD